MSSTNGGIVGTAGRVADSIVTGFVGTPALLLIVVLNVAAMVAATYFLLEENKHDYQRAIEIAGLLRTCMDYNRSMVTSQQERLKIYTESDQAMRQRILSEHEEAEARAQAEVNRLVEAAKERLRLLEGQEGARYRNRPDVMIRRHGGNELSPQQQQELYGYGGYGDVDRERRRGGPR